MPPTGCQRYQSSGMSLNPISGSAIRIKVPKVSEGFGNQRPDPCSLQALLPAIIRPPGIIQVSNAFRLPCCAIWVLSKATKEDCMSSRLLGG